MSRDEFIEEFLATLERERLCEPQVRVELSACSGDAVSLDLIRVDPTMRGKRIASRVLTLFVQLSDASGVPLQVIPSCVYGDAGALGDTLLRDWYRRHGFVPAPTHDSPRLMRRIPRPLGRETT